MSVRLVLGSVAPVCLDLLDPVDPSTSICLLSVSLKISARTRSPDGLILLLSDAKQMDFAVVKLTGGKVTLSADLGKGPTSVTSPVSITDGHWHTVGHMCEVTMGSPWGHSYVFTSVPVSGEC